MKKTIIILLALNLAACASSSMQVPKTSGVGIYKVGNPYKISGKTYVPKVDMKYRETGIASWYGADFHNGVTANGEKFNMNSMTAAHRTLPLPSIVRVTNLSNGKKVVLRVNDRGPFVGNRIIDVSKRAAGELGFHNKGVQKVLVEIMPRESLAAQQQAMRNGGAQKGVKPPMPTYFAQMDIKAVANISHRKIETLDPSNPYIQIGSFSNRESAMILAADVNGFMQEAIIDGRSFYRVQIGGFLSLKEAQGALLKVKINGFPEAKLFNAGGK